MAANRRGIRNGLEGRSPTSRSEPISEDYKVGPGSPPREFRWKPGQSGNPKGRKPKARSVATDLNGILKHALSSKVTLKQGEKTRVITKAAAGIEQLINQFAKGDRHARRDLFALAEKLGIDLFLGERKMIEEALAPNRQTILDAYVKRRTESDASAPSSSPAIAPAELLDDDTEEGNSE